MSFDDSDDFGTWRATRDYHNGQSFGAFCLCPWLDFMGIQLPTADIIAVAKFKRGSNRCNWVIDERNCFYGIKPKHC